MVTKFMQKLDLRSENRAGGKCKVTVNNFSKVCYEDMHVDPCMVCAYLNFELLLPCELSADEKSLYATCKRAEIGQFMDLCYNSLVVCSFCKWENTNLTITREQVIRVECLHCKRALPVKLFHAPIRKLAKYVQPAEEEEEERESKQGVGGLFAQEYSDEVLQEYLREEELSHTEAFFRLFEKYVTPHLLHGRLERVLETHSEWFAALLFEIEDSNAMLQSFVQSSFAAYHGVVRARLLGALIKAGLLDAEEKDEDYVILPQQQEDEDWICL